MPFVAFRASSHSALCCAPTAQTQILPGIPAAHRDTSVTTPPGQSPPGLRFLLLPPIPARSASGWRGRLSSGNSFHEALRHGSIRVTSFVASLTSRLTFQPGCNPRQALMSHSEPAALPGTGKRPSGPSGRVRRGHGVPFLPPPRRRRRRKRRRTDPAGPSPGNSDLRGRGKGRAGAEGGWGRGERGPRSSGGNTG